MPDVWSLEQKAGGEAATCGVELPFGQNSQGWPGLTDYDRVVQSYRAGYSSE
jgi:hypothetical protein